MQFMVVHTTQLLWHCVLCQCAMYGRNFGSMVHFLHVTVQNLKGLYDEVMCCKLICRN